MAPVSVSVDSERTLTVSVLLLLIVVVVGPLRTVRGVKFDCKTMLPDGRRLDEAQTMVTPCPIAVNIGQRSQNYIEGIKYTPGQTTAVQFSVTGGGSVISVFCRASKVMDDNPLGTWITATAFLKPITCINRDDALQSNNSKPISTGTVLVASWTPPSTPGNGDVEVICTVIDVAEEFWTCNSIMLGENQNK